MFPAWSLLWAAAGPGVGIPASGLCQALGAARGRGFLKAVPNPCVAAVGGGCLGTSAEGLGRATWGGLRLGGDGELPVVLARGGRRHGQFVVVLQALG